MLSLILKSIKNRIAFSFLFFLAIIIILLTLPLSISTIQENQIQVTENITKHSRGSYDILVRPLNSRNNVEKVFGFVEENYLNFGQGGIAIEEWREIQEMVNIEIAAPVAGIGYFTGMSKSFALPMPNHSIRTTAQFYTSNGIKKYKLRGPRVEIMLIREKVVNDDEFERLMNENVDAFGGPGPPQYTLPNTFHFLVGVNPENEEKLTGISFKALRGNMSPRQEKIYNRNFSGSPIVKVMKLKDPDIPIYIDLKTDSLDINSNETSKIKAEFDLDQYDFLAKALHKDQQKYNQMLQYLLDYPAISTRAFKLDFSNKLDPFDSTRLMVNNQGKIVKNTKYGNYYNYGNTTIYYTPSRLDYMIDEKNQSISVSKTQNDNGVPVYREIKEMGKPFGLYEQPPFFITTVGSYEIGDRENELAASPLGIYSLTATTLESNGKELYSTIYPGSFVPSPAHGVTTIEAAEEIKGDRPIDAIRVRVSGLDGYTEAASKKIKKVAKNIADKGFEVDIVAGASHQRMKIDVEGIGNVLEPWTTLGAAVTIVNEWNMTSIILSIAFTIVCMIYIINRILFTKVEQQGESILLSQLGWEKKHIIQKTQAELSIICLIGLTVSVFIFIIFKPALHLTWTIVLIQFIIFLTILLYIFLLIRITKQFISVNKKYSHRIISIKQKRSLLPLVNLLYYKKYISLSFLQIGIVSAFSTFVYLSVQSTIEQTDLTVLGKFINLQSGSFQTIIITGAYLLGLFTMLEGLSTLFQIRRSELINLQSIGWEHRHIFYLLLSEIAFWSAASVILGGILSMTIYTFLYEIQISIVLTGLILLTCFYIAILIVSSMIIWFMLKKMQNV